MIDLEVQTQCSEPKDGVKILKNWTNNSTVAEIKGIRLARRLALNAQVSSGPAFSRDPDHDPARLEN